MKLDDILSFIGLCEANDIEFYLDGGWGVDALLGRQTREHNDLDIGIPRKDAAKLKKLLEQNGYKETPMHDSSEWNYVLKDRAGHEVDVHTYEFDEQGHHVYGVEYPIDSLTGKGTINGKSVNCIGPRWMVEFHTWYEPDENDYHDVRLLCEKFKIPLPDKYKKFQKQLLQLNQDEICIF